MGRSIASVTQRLDGKLGEWQEFAHALPEADRKAFLELVAVAKNRRSAVDAAGEADISVAILLAISTHLKRELNALRETNSRNGLKNGFTGP